MREPYIRRNRAAVYLGNVREVLREMDSESVHCCITSPPYYSLRDYGVDGQIGLEETPEEYIAALVDVFSEVRRVLRKDATLWLNLGDSYAATTKGSGGHNPKQDSNKGSWFDDRRSAIPGGLKPKDLMMMPARVALALQADGWWLRSEIVWHKPNPMPESVTDRPTKAHEMVYLLAKSARYFFDQEAVKEPASCANEAKYDNGLNGHGGGESHAGHDSSTRKFGADPRGRNIRTVWTIPTEPFPEAHFATFPQALVEPCIKAGTSERGCCPECGAPWRRVVEKSGGNLGTGWTDHKADISKGMSQVFRADGGETPYRVETLGWQPPCRCDAGEAAPCVVLDPFSGSGTTLLVAQRLGRRALGIEIKREYADISGRSLAQEVLAL